MPSLRGAGRRRRVPVSLRAGVAMILVTAALASCAGSLPRGLAIRPFAATRNVKSALEQIEPLDSKTSRLLYLYERGLILREGGDYRASNEALERAQTLYEDLYTRSLSREVGAFFTGDYVIPYRGERFEAAFVHYYKIMNYLRIGETAAALVECRRLNHLLQVLQDGGGSFYVRDPLLQYLTGMVYALAGERADADVSLRVALDAYRSTHESYGVEIPGGILCDLAENARALGNRADADRYRQEGGCPAPRAFPVVLGSLRLFLECGSVPLKVENALFFPIYQGEVRDGLDETAFARELTRRHGGPPVVDRELEYLLKVAVPALVPSPSPVEYAKVRAIADAGEQTGAGVKPSESAVKTAPEATSALAANLSVLARESFEEKQGEILARAAARGLVKYLASRKAGGNRDQRDRDEKHRWLGRLVNLFGVATEEADTRCWSGLPDRILLSSLDLAPGKYRLEVELFDASRQRTGLVSIPDVEIVAGRSTILSHRLY